MSWKGVFRQWNINLGLSQPLLDCITGSWAEAYNSQSLPSSLEKDITKTITSLFTEIESSAPLVLKEHINDQRELCVQTARTALQEVLHSESIILATQRKRDNRGISVFVQHELEEGYTQAAAENGKGVGKRRPVR